MKITHNMIDAEKRSAPSDYAPQVHNMDLWGVMPPMGLTSENRLFRGKSSPGQAVFVSSVLDMPLQQREQVLQVLSAQAVDDGQMLIQGSLGIEKRLY